MKMGQREFEGVVFVFLSSLVENRREKSTMNRYWGAHGKNHDVLSIM
jgi:hypothetical protein